MTKIPQPAVSTRGEPVTRRFTEQRWLIDNVIRSVGIDWDQPRSIPYNAPCGPEANADFAAIRERVKKLTDIAPAFETAARRREAKAKTAEDEGAPVTARQNCFIAAVHYAASQWTFDVTNEKNIALNARKRDCYASYARRQAVRERTVVRRSGRQSRQDAVLRYRAVGVVR